MPTSKLEWSAQLTADFTALAKPYQWKVVPARHGQTGFYVELWADGKRQGLVQQYPATMTAARPLPEAVGRGDPSWPTVRWAKRAAAEKTWDLRHPPEASMSGLDLLAIIRRPSRK